MSFSDGEYVMYGTSGVCIVTGIEKKCPDGQNEKEYIRLVPINSANSKYYIPYENADGRIRKLLSADEINRIIDEMPDTEAIWCNDNHKRKEIFSSIIKSDDYRQIIGMIKSIHEQKIQRISDGKKLASADEMLMKKAEELMYQEFSTVLDIGIDEVENYIINRIES